MDIEKEIEKTFDIYQHITLEAAQNIPKVTYDKDTIFIPAEKQENIDLFYILDGYVEIYSCSYNGRIFLFDKLGPGEFIGKFSQMRKQNLYCEVKTVTQCTMLRLTDVKKELFNDSKFALYFYIKTSDSVYQMYKNSMARTLFTYEELMAYHLLIFAKGENIITEKSLNLRLLINISERQYFYLIKKMCSAGIISRTNSHIQILNREKLKEIAEKVLLFMEYKV